MDSLFHSSAFLHVRDGDGAAATINDRPNSATASKFTSRNLNTRSEDRKPTPTSTLNILTNHL